MTKSSRIDPAKNEPFHYEGIIYEYDTNQKFPEKEIAKCEIMDECLAKMNSYVKNVISNIEGSWIENCYIGGKDYWSPTNTHDCK